MLSQKLNKALLEQKERMLKYDVEEKRDMDPNSPHYFTEDGNVVTGMELIYDNTIQWLNSQEGRAALGDEFQALEQLSEDTLSTAAPTWTLSMLPLVRRLYHNIVARELVSIQPIAQPSAYVYWLNKTYTNTHAGSGVIAGTRLDNQQISQYTLSGETGQIREIQMSLERKLVEVHSDKLATDWTLEAQQDWRSQHKIDVEGEMVSELANEVRREIDRRVFNALLAGAAHTVNWNPTNYRSGDQNITLYRHAYEEEIYHALIDAQAWIMANKRGVLADSGVEWNVVMNSTNWARFAKLENFNLSNVRVSTQTGISSRSVGTLNELFRVFLTEEIDDCTILLTAKSGWLLSPGYYCPYIPLYTSPRYIINDDFTQFRRGVMSRQAYGILGDTSAATTSNLIVKINLCIS